MNQFAGKVAFVTGAANGIGRAAALAFAREGAHVVVADVSEQGNHETARMITDLGLQALAVRCDVSQSNDVRKALNATIERFGRLDFAFNNAGIEYKVQPTADVTEEEWNRIIDIDLRGVFLCMKHEIPLMLAQRGGAIVNTSSGAGIRGFKGGAPYVAAKHGVVGLTKAAALDGNACRTGWAQRRDASRTGAATLTRGGRLVRRRAWLLADRSPAADALQSRPRHA